MISGRRFLRAAALAAVLALAFAGGAMAAKTTAWQGGNGNWSEKGNWDKGTPTKDDTAIISSGTVTVDDPGAKAKFVQLGENATLKIAHGKKLTLSGGGGLHAFGDATVRVVPDEGLTFTNTNNIAVDAGKTLSLEGAGHVKGAGEIKLSGGGTLKLGTPITAAPELDITDGSTLVAEVNDALPDVVGIGMPQTVPITNGNIVVEGTDLFKKTLTSLRMTKGDLTLKLPLRPELTKVVMTEGTLTVHVGAKFGTDDAVLELGQDSSLDLRGDLTLGALKTAGTGTGTIAVAAGKTLTLKNGADTDIALPVTGHLRLEPTAGVKVALNKKAQTVTFKGNAAAPLLALRSAEGLDELRIEGGNPDEVTIRLEADMTVGVLSCPKLKECTLDFGGVKRTLTIGSLNPGDGAGIDIDNGPGALKIGAVSAPGDWGLSLEAVELELPGGDHKRLALQVEGDSALKVPAATSEPVLTVKKAEVDAGKKLTFRLPDSWHRPLKAGETIDLLKALDSAPGSGTIEADLTPLPGATAQFDNATKTLRLTLKGAPNVPQLPQLPQPTPFVDAGSWIKETVTDASGNRTAVIGVKLNLPAVPMSIDITVSKMDKPSFELLDEAGRSLLSAPSASAATKTYTLRMRGAVPASGFDPDAAIEKITVTLPGNKVLAQTVNKKLRDIPEKPANDDVPGGNKKSSGGGGGCDAGIGVLALALMMAFLPRRKA